MALHPQPRGRRSNGRVHPDPLRTADAPPAVAGAHPAGTVAPQMGGHAEESGCPMTDAATVVACRACGTRNRLPAAASGTPRCGRCKEAMAWIADADHATFPEIAEASPIPVIVDPWAPGCGPCRTVGPIVEELAGEFAGQYKLVQGQRRLRAPPRQPLRRPRHPDPGRPASRPGGIAPGGRGARRSASPMDGGGTPGVIGKGGNRCLSSPTSVPCSGPSGRPTSRSKQRHPWTRPSPTGTSSGCRCRVRSTSSVTAGVLGDIPRVRLQEHTGPAERAAALATPHGFDRARSLGHRRPGSRVPERGPMRRRRRWWPSTYPLRR